MQIPSVPPPIITNSLSQDVVAKAVPNVQAVQPLLHNAVAPAPKTEKSNQSRDHKNNKDRSEKYKEAQDEDEDKNDKDGHTVNISV